MVPEGGAPDVIPHKKPSFDLAEELAHSAQPQAAWEWEDGRKGSGDWRPCTPASPQSASPQFALTWWLLLAAHVAAPCSRRPQMIWQAAKRCLRP